TPPPPPRHPHTTPPPPPPPPHPTPHTRPPPPPPPNLQITLSKTNPTVNEDVRMQVSNSTGPAPSSATWDFGDGQQATGTIITHRWTTARTYQVSVQATLPNNQQASKSLGIQVNPIPMATLTVTTPTDGSVTGTGIACPSTCTATFNIGQSVTLTAAPAANYTFAGWSGACTGAGNCTLTMDVNKT